jgi:hypothetical protein
MEIFQEKKDNAYIDLNNKWVRELLVGYSRAIGGLAELEQLRAKTIGPFKQNVQFLVDYTNKKW